MNDATLKANGSFATIGYFAGPEKRTSVALEQRKTHFILGKYKLPVHKLNQGQLNASRNNNQFEQARGTQSTQGL